MLKYVDSLINHNCAWHTNSIYLSKFQVNTVTNIEVIRQNVQFSHTRVMVIGVSSDLMGTTFKITDAGCFNLIAKRLYLGQVI